MTTSDDQVIGQLPDIAKQLHESDKKVTLIYAFNASGKTRLSVEFKNITKDPESGAHAGIYYNAFSEDLFSWDNDNFLLIVKESSLNQYHGSLNEETLREKLKPYRPKFDFFFNFYKDSEKGIESVTFFRMDGGKASEDQNIKISRGEERIFVWCLFLALFEVEDWNAKQSKHLFVDDPVSSLDDHNIFITASTVFDLISTHFNDRKIIITTHHIGLFSILADWLKKGEKSDKFKKHTQLYILTNKAAGPSLDKPEREVFLYHLHLLQTLDRAVNEQLYTYHFGLLRQVLENISSFLGVGQFGYVLGQIGIEDVDQVASIVNALSHQKIYHYQTEVMNKDNEDTFRDVFARLKSKYNFVLHSDAP